MDKNTIEIIFKTQTKELDIARKKLQKLENLISGGKKFNLKQGQNIVALNKTISTLEKQISTTKKVNFENQGLVKTLQAGQKAAVGFNGAMLSLMFGGMALQRVAGGALTAIFETYKKLIPESDAFNKATTKLSANWEFFKFQLADAFAKSPLFQRLIQYAISLVQTFQNLNPHVKTFIVTFLGISVVVGTLLIIIGTLSLLSASLIDVGIGLGVFAISETGVLGLGTALKTLLEFTWSDLIDKISKIGGGFSNWLSDIKGKDIKNMLSSLGTSMSKFANTVVGGSIIIALALLTAFKISEKGMQLLGYEYKGTMEGMIGTTIDAVVGIIGIFEGTMNVIKVMFMTLVQGFWYMGKGIIDMLIEGIKGGDWDSVKSAFMDNFDKIDIPALTTKYIVNPMADLGVKSFQLKEDLNLVYPIGDTGTKTGDTYNQNTIVLMTPYEAAAQGVIDVETYNLLLESGLQNQRMLNPNI